VNKRTRTPLLATAIVTGVIWVMAMWLPLLTLAQITSFITLFIFSLINLALVVIKRREPVAEGVRTYPIIIPIGGVMFTSALLLFQLYHWLLG
jgi:amino acid transporter